MDDFYYSSDSVQNDTYNEAIGKSWAHFRKDATFNNIHSYDLNAWAEWIEKNFNVTYRTRFSGKEWIIESKRNDWLLFLLRWS